jgi:hypothetical protein
MARSLVAHLSALRAGEDVLRCLERLGFDDRRVRMLPRPHPLVVVIPAHLRLVTLTATFDRAPPLAWRWFRSGS